MGPNNNNIEKKLNNSVLHKAIIHVDFKSIKKILEESKSIIEERNLEGDTVLHFAARYDIKDDSLIFKYLLNEIGGGDSHIMFKNNNRGESILHTAVRFNNINIISILLSPIGNKSLIKMCDNNGSIPFHISCELGQMKVIELFYKNSEEVLEIRDPIGNTALHYAIRSGNYEIIQFLLDKLPELIHRTNFYRSTVFDECVKYGHLEILRNFLNLNSYKLKPINEICQKLLFTAVEYNKIPIKEILKLSPHIINDNIYASKVLNKAIEFGNLETIKELISIKIEFDKDRLIDISISHGHIKVLKYLLESTIIKEKDIENKTTFVEILNKSAQFGQLDIISHILYIIPKEIDISSHRLPLNLSLNSYNTISNFNENHILVRFLKEWYLYFKELYLHFKDKDIILFENKEILYSLGMISYFIEKDIKSAEQYFTQLEQRDDKFFNTHCDPRNDKFINDVFQLIKEGDAITKQSTENSYLILGKTGAGKSTLTHLLSIKQLKARLCEETGRMLIEETNAAEKDIKISHNFESETKIPGRVDILGKENLTIWDNPGFKDTLGPEQEIANAFYTIRLFKITKYIKFILVISDEDLTDHRGIDVIETIQQFTRLFNDINLIKNNFSIVITHCNNNKTIQHIKNIFNKILNENSIINDPKFSGVKTLLEHIRDRDIKNLGANNQFSGDIIHLFPTPEKEGNLFNIQLIIDISNSTKFIESNLISPQISISNGSIEKVKKLFVYSKTNLITKIFDIITYFIQNPYKLFERYENNSFDSIFKHLLPKNYKNNYILKWQYKYFMKMNIISELLKLPLFNSVFKDLDVFSIYDVTKLFLQYPIHQSVRDLIGQSIYIFEQQYELIKNLRSICKDTKAIYQNLDTIQIKNKLKEMYDNNLNNLEIEKEYDIQYYTEAIELIEMYSNNSFNLDIKDVTKETENLSQSSKIKISKCYYQIGNLLLKTKQNNNSYKDSNNDSNNKALGMFIKSIEYDNTNPKVYDKIGDIYFKEKKFLEAIEYFQIINHNFKIEDCFDQLFLKDRYNPKIHEKKGDYYKVYGLYQDAIKCYNYASGFAYKNQDEKLKYQILRKLEEAHQLNENSKYSDKITTMINTKKIYNF